MKKDKHHWFMSPTGHMFHAVKVLGAWRFVGRDTGMIRMMPNFRQLKRYVKNVLGFKYLGSV